MYILGANYVHFRYYYVHCRCLYVPLRHQYAPFRYFWKGIAPETAFVPFFLRVLNKQRLVRCAFSLSLCSRSSPALLAQSTPGFASRMFPVCKSRSVFALYYSATGLIGDWEREGERGRERSLMPSQGGMHAKPSLVIAFVCVFCSLMPAACVSGSLAGVAAPRAEGCPLKCGIPSRPCSTHSSLLFRTGVCRSLFPLPMAPFPTIMARCTFLSGCLLHSSVGGCPCRKTAPGG